MITEPSPGGAGGRTVMGFCRKNVEPVQQNVQWFVADLSQLAAKMAGRACPGFVTLNRYFSASFSDPE
jgi:hypothetical protein